MDALSRSNMWYKNLRRENIVNICIELKNNIHTRRKKSIQNNWLDYE